MKKKVAALEKASGAKVYPLSGATGEGVTPVLRDMAKRIGIAARKQEKAAEPAAPWRP